MSETMLGLVPLPGMLLILIGAALYQLGGRHGKWKRRYAGSFCLASSIWLVSALLGRFSLWYLLVYPLTVATFTLGYGADVEWKKWARRLTVVGASLVSSILILIVIGFPSGSGWVVGIELLIASTTAILGVKNPIDAAPEEYFVCLFLWSPKLMYLFL